MKFNIYIYLSFICLTIGMLYCAFAREWIIVRYPLNTPNTTPTQPIEKKQVTLFFWHHNSWKTETQDLLWSTHGDRNSYQLINAWLTLLDEENIMRKKITLQSALLSPSETELYLSFDHNPLPKQVSTFEKWMLIEGLLKTIRKNEIPIQGIHFLVYHQPLQDQHLDFSKAWPIQGFSR